MVDRFFFITTPQTNTESELRQRDQQPDPPIILLSGPPSSGKTSLLFQFALNSVKGNNGGTVVILCNRRRLEANPPFLSQGIDPSSEIFQRIHIKYVDDDEGIKNYFAALHLYDSFPLTVLIDDFADFFDERNCQERYNNHRGKSLAMVRVLALCRNAIDHANSSSKRSRHPCKLILSDTHKGDSPKLLYIHKRWVSCIYTTTKEEGDGSSYILRKTYYSSENIIARSGKTMRSAKYSIALQYLVFEGIIIE